MTASTTSPCGARGLVTGITRNEGMRCARGRGRSTVGSHQGPRLGGEKRQGRTVGGWEETRKPWAHGGPPSLLSPSEMAGGTTQIGRWS